MCYCWADGEGHCLAYSAAIVVLLLCLQVRSGWRYLLCNKRCCCAAAELQARRVDL
jgi:hypothetical protein